MPQPQIACKSSYKMTLEPGEYYWCACGKSKSQPFCDDTHLIENKFEPFVFEITEKKIYSICGCKHTMKPPMCDSTHKTL